MNAGSCGVPRTRSPNTSYRSNPASTKTVAARFIATARRRGVSIQTDVKVECIEENEGCVSGVRLSNGATIPYDVVITGIGIVPAVTPLIAAGAAGTNGVDVDEHCRTSLVDIFSIGDCAAHCNKFANGAHESPMTRCPGSGRFNMICGFKLWGCRWTMTERYCGEISTSAPSRSSTSGPAVSSPSIVSTLQRLCAGPSAGC